MNSFAPSVSGLQAASRGIEAYASNIANAHTTAPPKDAKVRPVEPATEAPRPRKDEPSKPVFRPQQVTYTAEDGGGVRARVQDREPSHAMRYDPTDVNADSEGMVAVPRVDYAREFVDIEQAQRSFEANLKAIEAQDELLGVVVDMKS